MSSATTAWRIAGMTYLQMAATATTTVRSALKEPMRSTALARDAVFYNRAGYTGGVQQPKTPVTSMFSK
eukprot:CAMPEP_0205908578 /NCGR_PEP_ID=MMETSP1325-20131115/3303_1 /ASSEMBLY_ACC=CAM_ASM_000708 /TAXON_ID=236786 /ORGANISM="Florenciella sp., Strain RCC1007" /LENGTH=68 /DNA_ID=CAMNT_0053274791 /DNA_START=53 /DNA_END=259 /DNA_ORIENTATION=+